MRYIFLQTQDRTQERRFFRRLATDMAGRYMNQMPLFHDRGLNKLGALLQTSPPSVPEGTLRELEADVTATRRKLKIPDKLGAEMRQLVDTYFAGTKGPPEPDVALAMCKILLHRFAKRAPDAALFAEFDEDYQPSKPLTADSTVYEGARLHLLHTSHRPFFCGMNDLCDASSEAEQFLRLSAGLVDAMASRLQRRKEPALSPVDQERRLRERAKDTITGGTSRKLKRAPAGPRHRARCLKRSLESNAPLGAGANALHPAQPLDQLPKSSPTLASVVKYAVAYNAMTLVPNYE